MLPLKLNLSKMKKISGDDKSTTFKHDAGHEIKIIHSRLPALQRKQLERLPVNLDEGTPDAPLKAGSGWEESDKAELDAAPARRQAIDDAVQKGVNFMTTPIGQAQAAAPNETAAPAPSQLAPPAQAQLQALPTAAPAQKSGPDNSAATLYGMGVKAAREQQDVNSQQAKADYDIGQQDLKDRQGLMADAQSNLQNYKANHDKFVADYSANHIDPNHYVENMGTPQKVMTAIGLLVGGFHAGATGQGNPAADFLDKQINRDIDGQKARMEQSKTLMGANQANFKDVQMANNETRMQMNDIYAHKISQAASNLGTPQAKANADAYISKLGLENQGLLQSQAMRGAALKAAGSGAARPETLIPYLVPAEHQKDAVKEAGQAQSALTNHDALMQHFDDAAKANTVLRTIGGLRQPADISALNALELPMIHDQEGRVNEFEQKTLHDLHPLPGDMDSKIAQKRVDYEQFILGKQQTPTLDTYAPQLAGRFKVHSSAPPAAAQGPVIKTMNGVPHQQITRNGQVGWIPVKQ